MITIRNVSAAENLISMQVFIENDSDNFFTVEFDRATGKVTDCSRSDAEPYIKAIRCDLKMITGESSVSEEIVLR